MPISVEKKVDVLLEEYKALYSLYTFRLRGVERRVPLAAIMLAAFLSAAGELSTDGKLIFLLGIPLGLLYAVRSAARNIQAFENLLRRIEQIESKINELSDETLLKFQITHPTKRFVGGKSSQESLQALFVLVIAVGAACVALFIKEGFGYIPIVIYCIYMTVVIISCAVLAIKIQGHQYTHGLVAKIITK